MAENSQSENQVIISVGADTSSLEQSIDSARGSLQQLGNTPVPVESIKSFKQQLKEAREAALALQQAGKENTQEYRNAVAVIAELRDQQDVLNRTTAAFDPGNRYNALIGISKSAAGAIQGVAGAFALVGANSDTALQTIQQLQGIMALTDSINQIGDLGDHWRAFTNVLRGATTAQEANTAATETGTIATKGLGIAMKGLGIGLIVAAVAYLVTNWDNLKESVSKLLPGLDKTGETFDKVKAIVIGVGSAVIDYLVTPFKVFIDLVKGDFKTAIADFKEGMNVVDNYQKGYQQQRLKQADEAARELAEKRAKELEDAIKIYKAAGLEVPKLEKEMYALKIKAQKQGTDDYNKAIQEQSLYEAAEYKKANDKAKQEADKREQLAKQQADKQAQIRKQALENIKKDDIEAAKVTNAQNTTARDKELADLTFDYNRKIVLYKKWGADTAKLTEAFNIQKLEVNKKYDEQINAAIKAAEDKNLSVYEQKKQAINLKIDELLKNATDAQKAQLEQLRKNHLEGVNKEQSLNDVNVKANVNLITTSSENVIGDRDTPEQRYNKTLNVLNAQRDAEQAAFELKKETLGNNQAEIEELTATHNANLTQFERDRVQASKDLTKNEVEYKAAQLDIAGNALSAFADLAGQQTIAGKALAVSSATLTTYQNAVLAYRNGLMVPGPVGLALAVVSAAAAVASGISNVKKILSVKVPGKGTGGVSAPSLSAPSISDATAPTIDANILNNTNQVQDVRLTNTPAITVKAVITDKDIQDSKDRNSFFNNLSTL